MYDDYAGRVSASLATKINPSAVVHNPGSQGRVSRRLQDPYGCQDDRRACNSGGSVVWVIGKI